MKKHAELTRPQGGHFARWEWAITGTPCSEIKHLAKALIEKLSGELACAYIDADHRATPLSETPLASGARAAYTDKIAYDQWAFAKAKEGAEPDYKSLRFRQMLSGCDLAIVNGNHFRAQRQLVVIDSRKRDSLQRKLDRLTAVDALLFAEGESDIPDYLRQHLPHADSLPRFSLQDAEGIATLLRSKIELPPVYGLLLAGGRSRRMGRDKSLLNYHGKPQREYQYELLEKVLGTGKVFLSCRPEQTSEMPQGMQLLPDSFLELGPYGAILSAFRQNPNAAWLVMAIDLPLAGEEALHYLLQHRRPGKAATAFRSPLPPHFPDPLLTIWEPKAYPDLLKYLALGYSCPRKVLINTETALLDAPNPQWLKNVNTPEEMDGLI